MDPNWKRRVLELKQRATEAEDSEYVTLIEQMTGRCTLDVAQVLLQTFTNEPDDGIQESAVSVLASAAPEVYLAALLGELPRLLDEAPEWAETLVGREIHSRPARVIAVAQNMDKVIQDKLAQLVMQRSFIEFYPNAEQVIKELNLG